MGRAFYVLIAVYLVGLAVCVEEALRWADEEEALGLEWDLRGEDERDEAARPTQDGAWVLHTRVTTRSPHL